jgi:hypothetical protein
MSRYISARCLAVVVTGLISGAADQAFACPLCFESSGRSTLHAFYLTTALLTVLPIAVVGFLIVSIGRMRNRNPSPHSVELAKGDEGM